MTAPRRGAEARGHARGAARRGLVAALTLVALASGCGGSNSADDKSEANTPAAETTEVAEPSTVQDAITEGAKIIDVRTPEEFATGHLTDAVNIDLSDPDFAERIADLDKTASYVVYCASGNRAGTAIGIMREQGFDDLLNGGGYEDLALGVPTT